MATKSKSTSKRTKKVDPTSKEALVASAVAIMERDGVGFVKAMIRARKEVGLVSPNLGKPRLTRKEQAALAAEGASA